MTVAEDCDPPSSLKYVHLCSWRATPRFGGARSLFTTPRAWWPLSFRRSQFCHNILKSSLLVNRERRLRNSNGINTGLTPLKAGWRYYTKETTYFLQVLVVAPRTSGARGFLWIYDLSNTPCTSQKALVFHYVYYYDMGWKWEAET